MNLETYVNKCILNYPSHYKGKTYEESRLRVLEHALLCNGNGLEWANTENPEDGGYLTDKHKYDRDTGERKLDAKYFKRVTVKLPEHYFETEFFEIKEGFEFLGVIQENGKTQIKIKKKEDHTEDDDMGALYEILGMPNQVFRHQENRTFDREKNPDNKLVPYPIEGRFSKVNTFTFIQEDWLQGAIDIMRYVLAFYKDPENKKLHYRSFENNYHREKKSMEEKSAKGKKELRNIWGYKGDETVKEHCQRIDDEFVAYQIKVCEKFLKKYDNKQKA